MPVTFSLKELLEPQLYFVNTRGRRDSILVTSKVIERKTGEKESY